LNHLRFSFRACPFTAVLAEFGRTIPSPENIPPTSTHPAFEFQDNQHYRPHAAFHPRGGFRKHNVAAVSGVNNAAVAQYQAVCLQVPANLFEQPVAQIMTLQKMPELENSNLFRQSV
tara:strand:- start:347 stop:697 length:351 start_codon:yes stop_codon:yes gene_type:complete